MVESTGLENRHTGNGIVSSNLSLSVVDLRTTSARWIGDRAASALGLGVQLLVGMGGRVV